MFRTCLAFVLKNRPISEFMWLNDLDEKKAIKLGTMYRTENVLSNSFKLFLESFLQMQSGKI